ncbi:MAG: glycosyltransferase family 2 protein [Bacteroidales bacterium]|nr:glycosyltransferase family 2 protein [Bacteroidales bacterium]
MSKNNTYPLVSIITINYDHPEVTCDLLESLKKITYPNIEIIVIDNASPNDDPSIIKEKYPEIIFIQNKKNYGFAVGNNIGIKKAKGKYILLLNNDTVVDEKFLEPLVLKCESDKSIGAVSPKIRFHYSPETIQYAGLTPINSYTVRSKGIGFGEKDRGQYEEDRITAYAHGAAMLFPKEILKKVGMMSDIFFLYYEELDWGYRLRQAGYKIYYVHNSLIYHKESMSTGKLSPFKIYYLNRSRILYMRRNIHGIKFVIGLFFQLFFSIPKNALFYLLKGKYKLCFAYFRAIFWHIKNIFNKKIHENIYYK